MATFGGGLNVFDTKTKKSKQYRYSENNPNTISSDYIHCILKDTKGNLWIGTSGEGVNFYDSETKTINRFNDHENIRSQSIVSIIEDNTGLIWFSTKQGIFNYSYKTNRFKSLSNLVGEYHINASFKDNEGFLYFGSSKGLIKFNPATNTLHKTQHPEVRAH